MPFKKNNNNNNYNPGLFTFSFLHSGEREGERENLTGLNLKYTVKIGLIRDITHAKFQAIGFFRGTSLLELCSTTTGATDFKLCTKVAPNKSYLH